MEVDFVRIILKILAMPFVVALTIFGALFAFIMFLSWWVFALVSFLVGILGVISFFTNEVFDGCVLLILAFLVSPFGLPAVVEWIADKLDDLNYTLKDFITS